MTTQKTEDTTEEANAEKIRDADELPSNETVRIITGITRIIHTPRVLEGETSGSGKTISVSSDTVDKVRLDAREIFNGETEFRNSRYFELYTPGEYRHRQRMNKQPGPRSGTDKVSEIDELPEPTHYPNVDEPDDAPEVCPNCGQSSAPWRGNAEPRCIRCGELASAAENGEEEAETNEGEATEQDPYKSQTLEAGDTVRFSEVPGSYTVVTFAVDAHNVPELVVATPGLKETHEVDNTPEGYAFTEEEGAVRIMGEMEIVGDIELIEKTADPRTVAEYMADNMHRHTPEDLMGIWRNTPTPEEYADELEEIEGVRRAVSTWESVDIAVLYDPEVIDDAGELVDRWSGLDVTDYDASEYNLAEFYGVDGVSDAPYIAAVDGDGGAV